MGLVAAPVLILGADAGQFSFSDVEVMRTDLVGARSVEVSVIEGGRSR